MNWSNEWGKPITPSRFANEEAKEADKQRSDAQKIFDDQVMYGRSFSMDGKHIPIEDVLIHIEDVLIHKPEYQTQQIKLGNKTISVIVVGDLGLDFCEPREKDEGWNIYHLPTLQSVSSAVSGTFDHRVDCAIAMNKTCNCGYDDGLKYGPYYNYDKPELLRWMAKVQTNYTTSWEVLRVLTPDDYHDKGTINKEIIKKWCLSVKVE